MSSTNKTNRLGLNLWVKDDPFLREDFNADHQKIDAAFSALSDLHCSAGQYAGISNTPQTIALGFRPKFIFFVARFTYDICHRGFMLGNCVFCESNQNQSAEAANNSHMLMTATDGFTNTGFSVDKMFNGTNLTYHYVAFG